MVNRWYSSKRLNDPSQSEAAALAALLQTLSKTHNRQSEYTVEEVIDELRERNEPVPVALELPDEETLVEIQEQILIHLPFALREFLLTVSDVVYGRLEPVTASDPHSHTYLPEVAATAWDLGLPRYLVPVCQDAAIYYAVDEDGEVFAWDCDSQELLEDTWESVWHWARDVWLES